MDSNHVIPSIGELKFGANLPVSRSFKLCGVVCVTLSDKYAVTLSNPWTVRISHDRASISLHQHSWSRSFGSCEASFAWRTDSSLLIHCWAIAFGDAGKVSWKGLGFSKAESWIVWRSASILGEDELNVEILEMK